MQSPVDWRARLLAVNFGGRPVFQGVDGKVAEVDGQLSFADKPHVRHALHLARYRDAVADFVLPNERHLLEEDGGVLHQVARLPHLEKSARVNPDFTLEQALTLLPGTDFENVHVPSGAPDGTCTFSKSVPGRSARGCSRVKSGLTRAPFSRCGSRATWGKTPPSSSRRWHS